MPDRTPSPGEGNGQQYQLPDQYGPARAPRRSPSEAGASVVVRPAGPTAVLDHEVVTPPPTPTRAEIAASRPKRSPWVWRSIALALVIVMIPVGISYLHALQAPGTDSLGIRTVEWVRDHGGNGVVNTVERWWYTNNPPPKGGTPDKIDVARVAESVGQPIVPFYVPNFAAPSPIQHLSPPTGNRVPTPAAVVEQNEGVWQATGRTVGSYPAVYTTYVRPNATNTSYYTGLMWLDTKLLRASYVVGLNEPGGGPNPWNSQIPASVRGVSVAAFNSGFKMDSARGGAWLDGQEIKPLVNGSASFVIKKDGSASVGMWGRDFVMGSDVQAVRQNLELLVDNHQLNPAVREDDTTVFGATLGNKALVWRSGVGIDANGALIYAGGPALSVMSLARTLLNAGAVRAMELDINTDWVSAYTYVPQDIANPSSPTVGVKLLDAMSRGGDRYFAAGERDFFTFLADPKILEVPTGKK